MSEAHIDLHFADISGTDHVVEAVSLDGRRWHLRTPVQGAEFTKYCHDWQAVERTMRWLQRHAHEPLHQQAPRAVAIAIGMFLLAAGAAASAQTTSPSTPAIQTFIAATREYASMHRRLEQGIGPIELNTTPEAINRFIQAMAAAIRAERPDAKPGDLFTPAVAMELRGRIHDALLEHGFTAADVRAEAFAHGIDDGTIKLRVNGPFPWVLSVAMFPCLIEALPPLPPELQYRIVGTDLLLIDMHASLIVDILPSALADLTARASRIEGAIP